MKLFIAILQFNKWMVTKKCIDCILMNTNATDYDIFILDNNSSDSSYDEIKNTYYNIGKVNIRKNENNSGVIGGRNILFEWFMKEKEYTDIIFLDNDQFVNKEWDIYYSSIRNVYSDSIIGIESWILGSNLAPVKKCTKNDKFFSYVGCGGMMISRNIVEKVGTFDTLFSPAYFEDPDYCLRAKNLGFDVIWNNVSKIDHLAHQTLGIKSLNAKDSFRKSLHNFKKKWSSDYKGGVVFENKTI